MGNKHHGRRPHFDYDGDVFYEDIFAFAMQGMTDAEIAYALAEKHGVTLSPDTFSMMKNGRYAKWTDKQNERRSGRIVRVLSRGRSKINSIVRGAFLKSALGGKIVKTKVKQAIKHRCECGISNDGEPDPECTQCGGTGWYYVTEKVVIQETETELPPNAQAMTTWLHHHDAEWRKRDRNLDQDADSIPKDVKQGVDIEKWIDGIVTGGGEDAVE